jgi:hypothetical protein
MTGFDNIVNEVQVYSEVVQQYFECCRKRSRDSRLLTHILAYCPLATPYLCFQGFKKDKRKRDFMLKRTGVDYVIK